MKRMAQGTIRCAGTVEFGVKFEADLALEIQQFATAYAVNFSEAVRTLAVWGLESLHGFEADLTAGSSVFTPTGWRTRALVRTQATPIRQAAPVLRSAEEPSA